MEAMSKALLLRTTPRASATPAPARRFQQGDEAAFAALVDEHVDDLYTFCLRVTRCREDAHDLAHDTLLRARQKHALFDPRRPFRPWLLTMARNLWMSRLRSPWHRLRTAMTQLERSFAPSPEEHSEATERDAAVRRVLSTLPPKYCEAVSLFHLEDMSYAEMSAITGVSTAALKQRVARGKVLLAEKLTRLSPELLPERRENDD